MPIDRQPSRKELRRVGSHIRRVTFSNRRGPDSVDKIAYDPSDMRVPASPDEYEGLPTEYKDALGKPGIER